MQQRLAWDSADSAERFPRHGATRTSQSSSNSDERPTYGAGIRIGSDDQRQVLTQVTQHNTTISTSLSLDHLQAQSSWGCVASKSPDWWDEHLSTKLQAIWCENDGIQGFNPDQHVFFCVYAIFVKDSRTSSDAPYRTTDHAVSIHLGPSVAGTLSYLDFLDFHPSSGRMTWNDLEDQKPLCPEIS